MARELDLAQRVGRARQAVLAMVHDSPAADIPGATVLTLAEVTDRTADLRTLIDRLAGLAT